MHEAPKSTGGGDLPAGGIEPSGTIVGRDAELAAIADALAAVAGGRTVVLVGAPGVGKTTLWEAAVDTASRQGVRVLSARPTSSETEFSFAGLIDLFDQVGLEELEALAAPQRHALEIALLRATPDGAPPEPSAIAVGVLSALRLLAEHGPVLVAVDDAHWLDRPSARALAFAARRLDRHRVGFLLARRPPGPAPLEASLPREQLQLLDIAALDLDATQRLLVERLDVALPRSVLRRVFDVTAGNPLFVIELGRSLLAREPLAPGEELPHPDGVEDLLDTRMSQLAPPLRGLVLAVALAPEADEASLAELAGSDTLEAAFAMGLVVRDRGRVRTYHPLLASVALEAATPEERRETHLALAGVVRGEERRVLYLALASAEADRELAARVAAASGMAARRGARPEAVALAEHALRLTPQGDDARSGRVLALAQQLADAGEQQRLTDLLTSELEGLPTGAGRARASLLLIDGVVEGNDDIRRYLERALDEAGDDQATRALALAQLAENAANIRVESIAQAERWAAEALSSASVAGPQAERVMLHALAWARALQGRQIDDLCERFWAVSDAAFYIGSSPERVAGQRLVWRGETARAREVLTRLLADADGQDEPYSYALQRLHLCELELRVGGWDAAARLLDEWAEAPERVLVVWPMYERCRALLAAGRGEVGEAERWAADALASCAARAIRWDQLEAQRARAVAALLRHDTQTAVECASVVLDHVRREGVEDPGVFPVAPDLVEALVELGRIEQAVEVTRWLSAAAAAQDHPWAQATADRCAALVRLASEPYDEAVSDALWQAADRYDELGLPFDAARSVLALGRVQRRLRKWGAARRSLERAVAAFDDLGSAAWADDARSELSRVGARRPRASGELTPAERRVVELASEGRSNKEIAQALFVTVHTVEAHLTNAYVKLGVRSRAQLAARLVAGS
jgi:DNA-binding CsgD family transcriptional regulator